ncbi:MAG: glucan biosynthesis protein D [Pseudomonadota bacterium]
MNAVTRRDVLGLLAALGLAGPVAHSARAEALALGPATPFDFETLVARAKLMSTEPYGDTQIRAAEVLEDIDYDAHWKIKFRPEHTAEAAGGAAPLQMFHLGRYFKMPVGIHLVGDDGLAREVTYDKNYFDMPANSPAQALPEDIGFAGFRVMDPGGQTDWLAFLGAAYFRSSGELDQYGLSARALAINAGLSVPEEFPRFTDFWFAPSDSGTVVIYCLLDSPSITGAVRMDTSNDGKVIMDITGRYFARTDIVQLGLAPLTSMFWYSELNTEQAIDWRPEIHDSDGLALWTGAGERIWRPLNNPPRVVLSSFSDTNPRGFALSQRDRDFENYQDDGVFYEKRSTVWVEPKGDWGPGKVQLLEIPTDDEIHDNIVVSWVSDNPVAAGDEIAVDYRLWWVDEEPYVPALARAVHSRKGMGGVPGQPRPEGVRKFVVDFEGGGVEQYGQTDGVEAVVSANSGEVFGVYALPVVGTNRWRAVFDFAATSLDPVEMRLFLRRGEDALSETWAYQYHPTEIRDSSL